MKLLMRNIWFHRSFLNLASPCSPPLTLFHHNTISVAVFRCFGTKAENQNKEKYVKNALTGLGMVGGLAVGYLLFEYLDKQSVKEENTNPAKTEKHIISIDLEFQKRHLTFRKDLPTYKMDEVRNHDSLEKGIWITYGSGVYDITKFVPQHPGSDKILLGAGAAIDPFWHIYQQHNTEQILKLLETFRIGNLSPEDNIGVDDLGSPWENEPKRHPILKPASLKPFNAEPPPSILTENFITPVDFFYVRNHLPVPKIDVNEYELEVEIENETKRKIFTLDDIKKLPKYTITAAIMCGGNRRSEMNEVKVVKGLSWSTAAVGNARWSGARLRDVLELLGIASDETSHVIFEGLDIDPMSVPYAASIPLSKAMDSRGDVILVYEMNGNELTRDHGYPLRVIVPGVVGARNVKWVTRIIVAQRESDSHWQQNDYKGFSPSTDWDTVDFSKSPAIQNMPVTSAICYPLSGDTVKIENGYITVRGYAWSGGGNRIIRVDLTADHGETWHVADLEQESDISGRHWAWTLWTAKLPVDCSKREVEIWSKAVDSNYNCQPESFKNIWNLRGVLSNAYHRVKLNLK